MFAIWYEGPGFGFTEARRRPDQCLGPATQTLEKRDAPERTGDGGQASPVNQRP